MADKRLVSEAGIKAKPSATDDDGLKAQAAGQASK